MAENEGRGEVGRPRASLAEIAHARLKAAIQAHEFMPGDRMREADLAEWLGISRTPTRDALRQLEAEGLLEAATRRGLVVATLDQQRVSEIYDVRAALESLAARRAARQSTQAEIALLRENIRRQEEMEPKEIENLLQLNSQFHTAIYRASRNRYLIAALQSLETPLALLPGTTYADPNRPTEALDQHRALVDALEAGDADKAEQIAIDHVRAAERIRLVRLASDEDENVS